MYLAADEADQRLSVATDRVCGDESVLPGTPVLMSAECVLQLERAVFLVH